MRHRLRLRKAKMLKKLLRKRLKTQPNRLRKNFRSRLKPHLRKRMISLRKKAKSLQKLPLFRTNC